MMYLVVGVGIMIGLLVIIVKAVVIIFDELDKKEHPMESLKEKRKRRDSYSSEE